MCMHGMEASEAPFVFRAALGMPCTSENAHRQVENESIMQVWS